MSGFLTKKAAEAKQFITKKEAEDAALSIGWRRSDAQRIEVMGFQMWAIEDEHCSFLTIAGFDALLADREQSRR